MNKHFKLFIFLIVTPILSTAIIIIRLTPKNAPARNDIKRVIKVYCHPINAPIIAINLISPPPIASFLKINHPKRETHVRLNPPNKVPPNDLSKASIFDVEFINEG